MEIDMNEVNKRQISFKGKSLKELPDTENIIVVVYASYDDIFLFNGEGLGYEGKKELVNCLITEMQSGTNVSREIVKIVENIYFVY